jgi:hypothetical protein
MRSRISPSLAAGPQGLPASTGIAPYGARPSMIRSAPITPAYPTSITVRAFWTSSPARKPTRKRLVATSAHTGQRSTGSRGRALRRKPIQAVRARR